MEYHTTTKHKLNMSKRKPKLRAMVKKMIKGAAETKHYDLLQNSYSTFSYAGSVYQVSNISQGDGRSTRDGDKVHCTYVKLGMTLAANATTAGNARVMLVQDKLNLGTTPTGGNILSSASTLRAPICEINTESFPKRWRVLYDRTYKLDPVAGTNILYQNIKTSVKVNAPVYYTGQNGTDEGKNQIYMLVISDAAVNFPSAVWNVRMYYKDL